MPNLLTATAASVVFGNFVALDQVSAAFHPGEVTLLMGASGSGKTTLLALLGFLRSPDSGRIELLGENLSAWSRSLLPDAPVYPSGRPTLKLPSSSAWPVRITTLCFI